MGIKHFSGLFVMLCVGVALSLLTTVAEHAVHKLVIPRVQEPRFKYWLHTSQRLHRALNSAFTDDQLTTVTQPEKRCNEGNSQSASWKASDSAHPSRSRLLLKQIQKDLERPPAQELPCSPAPLGLEKHRSNGRSELGRGASGPALTPGPCRGLGSGDRGPGLDRVTLVQELSELEGQIQVIKQQLQAALRRKQELERFQSDQQQARPGTGPGQPQSAQSHQQDH